MLYPDIYIENVTKITMDLLNKNNIKALILDIDNTLIDLDRNILEGAEDWTNEMKKNNIKLFILSNTNKVDKVEKVAKKLDIQYINFARKPSKSGFNKVKKILNLNSEEIGVVGDQIFTDVFGGNRSKMFTILTKPIDKRDILITKVKRPLERIVIQRYLKTINKGKKGE